MAIVAEADVGPESELVGVARYGPSGDGTIDVGLVVADGWHGLGLATSSSRPASGAASINSRPTC